MKRPTLDALVIKEDDSGPTLCSPTTGRFRLDRSHGEIVTGGSRLGVLFRDERAIDLLVPAGVTGRIEVVHPQNTVVHADHGYALLSLSTTLPAEIGARAASSAASGAAAAAGDAQAFEVRSATHGTFYHRASPDSEPYVRPGQAVDAGQTVGLIEVMKCFSPVHFEPPTDAGRGRVREILPGDGDEVRSGDVLMVIDLE